MLWICCYSHLSQTATKDATIHSTAIDVDRCGLAVCRIYSTKCRTAIDVTFHEASTRVGDTWSFTRLGTHVHNNITANYCRLTTSTTIDVVAHGTIHHVYLGVTIYISGITTTIDIVNGRSLMRVVFFYRHLGITRCRSTGGNGRLVAAAKDISCNRGITLDGQVGFAHLSQCCQVGIGIYIMIG